MRTAMKQALTFSNLFDPRGRVDRKGLFWLAMALLVCQGLLATLIMIDHSGPAMVAAVAVKAVLLWIGLVALIKRLHDIGLSAVWIPIGLFAIIVWSNLAALGLTFTVGLDALNPLRPEFGFTFGLCLVPPFGGLLWLHFAKGHAAPNRYGVPPGPSGFSGPPALLYSPTRTTQSSAI
jgi:uncharacterized membrane protein YhaH (DUF805 family)